MDVKHNVYIPTLSPLYVTNGGPTCYYSSNVLFLAVGYCDWHGRSLGNPIGLGVLLPTEDRSEIGEDAGPFIAGLCPLHSPRRRVQFLHWEGKWNRSRGR